MKLATLAFATGVLASPMASVSSMTSLTHEARDEGSTAARKFGWKKLAKEDQFEGTQLKPTWHTYNGPGHAGNGKRTGKAISVKDGIMTIAGTPDGTTGGMDWGPGQLYGRWETRARYAAGTSAYHPVLLLWPDKEDWPVGGEVDYSEVSDGKRQKLDFFLHYGKENRQEHGMTQLDMTTWHNYAVEWTKDHVVGWVDGNEFFRSKTRDSVPPRAMHATIQLDWFPDGGPKGPGKMEVDWIRQYTL